MPLDLADHVQQRRETPKNMSMVNKILDSDARYTCTSYGIARMIGISEASSRTILKKLESCSMDTSYTHIVKMAKITENVSCCLKENMAAVMQWPQLFNRV